LAQVNAVSARDLHEKLGVKQPVTMWAQYRIKQAMLAEGQDFVSFSEKSEKGGRPLTGYYFTLDAAKHIAMLERTEVGKAIRQYFIDIEKAAAEGAQENARLKSAMEDAQAALLEGLTAKVKALTPAAELGNAVTKGRTEWPVNMAAKELGVPRPVLTWVMRKSGFMS